MADERVNKNGKASEKAKAKKNREPGRIRRWFKDFFSELKKVTWPTFPKVLKQTGIVLMVTLCFLVVMIAFDSLLGFLNERLISGLTEESIAAFAALTRGGGGLL